MKFAMALYIENRYLFPGTLQAPQQTTPGLRPPGRGGSCVTVQIGINPNTWTPTLARSGYGGWLVVEAEQDLRRYPPLEYARLGYANLRRLAGAAGFALA
jgi:sugar phosphate isomerase/epimerase